MLLHLKKNMQTISVKKKTKKRFFQIMEKSSKGEKFVITKDDNPLGAAADSY